MSQKNTWTSIKPEFTEECILIIATKYRDDDWDYTLFEIKRVEGYNDEDEPAFYLGVFEDGDEWGDLADLTADLYLVMPCLPKTVNIKNNES